MADSKWKGVDRLFRECVDIRFGHGREAEMHYLRERLEPLLEAAERLLNADLSEDIQRAEKILSEEVAKWR